MSATPSPDPTPGAHAAGSSTAAASGAASAASTAATTAASAIAATSPGPEPHALLCPYCGTLQQPAPMCHACGGCFDAWSLKATQDDMGAWFVRDSKRPHFVGFSQEALVAAIKAGEIGMNAIVRGPTTRQYWTIARRVPGIAHLFGRCSACQAPVREDWPRCGTCGAEPPRIDDRNFLGLPPVERVAAPADARADLSAFDVDSGVFFVRVAPVIPAVAAARLQTQIVPATVAVSVRGETDSAAATDAARATAAAEPRAAHAVHPPHLEAISSRSALSPVNRALAERVRSLERRNRFLFGIATISFLAAIAAVIASVAQSERHRSETDAKVNEAVRAIRSEFERKTPVVTPPSAELPPMPEAPAAPQPGATPSPSVTTPSAPR
jgi:hypothetical protein